jgi:aconitate hydratase
LREKTPCRITPRHFKVFEAGCRQDGPVLFASGARDKFPDVKRLPVSIRIVLESVLRNVDGKKVTEEHVKQLAAGAPRERAPDEIPFLVARVLLQDFTGVPLSRISPRCAASPRA